MENETTEKEQAVSASNGQQTHTVEELKAVAFDIMRDIELRQAQLRQVSAEIARREESPSQ